VSENNGKQRSSPEARFEHNGQTYTVRFGLVAMAELMDHFRLGTLDELVKHLRALQNQDLRSIAAVFRAGLAYHHPMSDQDALRLADDIGIQELLRVVSEAFQAAQPPPTEKTGGARPRRPGPSTA
jgi:hypothetical protein